MTERVIPVRFVAMHLTFFISQCLFHLMLHPCPLVAFPIDSIQILDCILRLAIELLHWHHLYNISQPASNLHFPLEIFTQQSYIHITLSVY